MTTNHFPKFLIRFFFCKAMFEFHIEVYPAAMSTSGRIHRTFERNVIRILLPILVKKRWFHFSGFIWPKRPSRKVLKTLKPNIFTNKWNSLFTQPSSIGLMMAIYFFLIVKWKIYSGQPKIVWNYLLWTWTEIQWNKN